MINNNKIAALLLMTLTASSNILGVSHKSSASADESDALYEELLPIARMAQNQATDLTAVTSPDRIYLALISESKPDAITITYDGAKKSATFDLPDVSSDPHALAYSPDGKLLACANARTFVYLPDGDLWTRAIGTGGNITVFQVSQDGGLSDRTSYALPLGFDEIPGWLAFSPDGKYLFVAHSQDSDIIIIFPVHNGMLMAGTAHQTSKSTDKNEAIFVDSRFYHRAAWTVGAVVAATVIVAGPLIKYCRAKTRVKQD